MQTVVRGQHIRPLDGLRGLAVLCVVAHHLNQRPFTGGYLGVDLFFVLSGFLITSLLFEEHLIEGRIALGRFYARRAKRLFPALAISLVATSVIIIVMGHWKPDVHAFMNMGSVRKAMLSSIFYVQNWMHTPVQTPVTHMWSLAVEEQFYVVWPLVVIGLARVAQRWRFLLIAPFTIAGFFAFALMHTSYTATYSRGGELLAGALLAFALQKSEVRTWFADRSRWLAPLSLLVFGVLTQTTQVGGMIRVPPAWMFNWGFALATVAIVGLVATTVASPGSPVGKILSWAPLVQLGLISYGLYVYHWAIFFYLTPQSTGWDWRILLVARVLVAVSIALVSYRYFELPMRRARYGGLRVFLAPLALVVCVVATYIATTPSIGAPYSSPPATALFTITSSTLGADDVVGSLDERPQQPVRKIQIVGDVAMARIAMPLTAALAQRSDITLVNNANNYWGLTSGGGIPKSQESQRLNVNLTALGVHASAPDLVILSSTLGDFPTVSHDVSRYREAMFRLVSLIVHQPSHPQIVLLLAAQPTMNARPIDFVSTSRVNRVMKDLTAKWPGQVIAIGSAVISNGSMTAPTFGPPNDQPMSATSQFVRWRPADGVAVCQPAVVRQAAMVLHVLKPKISDSFANGWWRGEWLTSPLFSGPSPCLSNHP